MCCLMFSFEEMEDGSLKIYMTLLYAEDSPVQETVFLDISGSGGVLYVGTGAVCVEHCIFTGEQLALCFCLQILTRRKNDCQMISCCELNRNSGRKFAKPFDWQHTPKNALKEFPFVLT